MKIVPKLKDMQLREAKAGDKITRFFDGDGLYLEVFVNGRKYWRFKYTVGERQGRMSLGRYPDVSLKDAREKRDELRKLVRAGVNPLEEKRKSAIQAKEQSVQAPTFGSIAAKWMEEHLAHKSLSYYRRIRAFIERFALPRLGDMTIATIKRQHVLDVAKLPAEAGHLESAHKLLQACSQIFRYAVLHGLIDYDITQGLHAAIPRQRVQHRPIIIDAQRLGHILRLFEGYNGSIGVQAALRLLPYLMVRPGELCAAEWTEVDLNQAQWLIPGAKMKMARPHIVPLASQILKYMHQLRLYTGNDRYVFPSERKGRHITVTALGLAMKSIGIAGEEISPHGFRGTASTWLNGQGFNSDWIERQLAHVPGDKVRGAYNHADYLPQRVKMMQAWANYLDETKKNVQTC